jgi:hypothetical protein
LNRKGAKDAKKNPGILFFQAAGGVRRLEKTNIFLGVLGVLAVED